MGSGEDGCRREVDEREDGVRKCNKQYIIHLQPCEHPPSQFSISIHSPTLSLVLAPDRGPECLDVQGDLRPREPPNKQIRTFWISRDPFFDNLSRNSRSLSLPFLEDVSRNSHILSLQVLIFGGSLEEFAHFESQGAHFLEDVSKKIRAV